MKIILSFLILLISSIALAQDKPFDVYSITADPFLQVKEAAIKAQKENKNILIQAGGNWCKWCRMFHKFSHENKTIDSLLQADYVVIYVNYSKENKNEAFYKKYNNANRFGFPVFLVLNSKEELLHIQDSGYLEQGQGYSQDAVERFLRLWNVSASKP
jgi:uncharacterized protein YyaL (SSP411 family)